MVEDTELLVLLWRVTASHVTLFSADKFGGLYTEKVGVDLL